LAVLGVFVEVGDKAHPTFDKLTEKFCSIKYSGMNTTKIDNVQILSMFPNNRRHFVRYSGSLTTPGCQESVIWTVFRDPISISQSQLNAFRALSHNGRKDGHDTPMEDNFRPVQPIGERTVLRNFDVIKPIQVVQFEQTFEEVEKTNSGQHITTSRLAILTVLVTFIAALCPSHF
jgi:carbonic anhydrase